MTVQEARRTAGVTIIWQGGATSTGTIQMNRPGAGHNHTLPDSTAALIGRRARHYDDSTIAHILARQRRTTGTGLRWTKNERRGQCPTDSVGSYELLMVIRGIRDCSGSRSCPEVVGCCPHGEAVAR